MKEKLEEICSGIPQEEFEGIQFAKWAPTPHARVTIIPYTFDPLSMAQELKKNLEQSYDGITMSALSLISRAKVEEIMEYWRKACGSQIEFKYVPKLTVDEPGITIVASDNIKGAAGVTNFNLLPGTNYLNQVSVCIPSNASTSFEEMVYAHEIGHALGMYHTHQLALLRQRLMTIPQGLGCSVMGYPNELETANNTCTTPAYCKDQPYAVVPGPSDEAVCTQVYAFPPYSKVKYFESMYWGFLNGIAEKSLATYLENVNFLKMSSLSANLVSVTYMTMLRSVLDDKTCSFTNALSILELTTRMKSEKAADILQVLRQLSIISMLFMQMYEIYASEDALNSTIYLTTFLGSSLCGLLLAPTIGKNAANLTNLITDKLGEIFNVGASCTAVASYFSSKLSWIGSMFHHSHQVDEKAIEETSIEYLPETANVFP